MADGTIFDQTQETALTAAHRLLVQDTSAATASQSATFALMGGLEHNAQTVTTADITGAVGQLYYCTIAGLTADRNLTLPASAQVGERIGVYIVDGDDTYGINVKGAATVTINGGSAATTYAQLSVKGEYIVFRCVSSTAWIVEADNYTAFAKVSADGSTTFSFSTDAVWTKVENLNTTVSDTLGLWDGTNERFNLPVGTWLISFSVQVNSTVTDAAGVQGGILLNGSLAGQANPFMQVTSATVWPTIVGAIVVSVTDKTDYYELGVRKQNDSSTSRTVAAGSSNVWMAVNRIGR